MAHPSVFIDWQATGILPTEGMQFWHQFRYGESGSEVAFDYSGEGRHIVALFSPPALTFDVWKGEPAWVFDGSNSPLTYSEPGIVLRHVFIVAAYQNAAFATNERGLLSGPTAGTILASETSGNQFYDLYPGGGVVYRKSDIEYPTASATAPMNAIPELIEWQRPDGVVMDGVQVGQQLDLTARKWIGPWFHQVGWNRVLNYEERRRVLLYHNLRFRTNTQGVPLYAPTADLVPALAAQMRVHHRFNDRPQDWKAITQSYEFEDDTRTFNEIADDTVRRWEYVYQNVPKAQKPIFDEFNNTARRAVSFYFKDPAGLVWSNVRLEDYGRSHEEHKRWRNDVSLDLVGYSSTVSAFETPPAPLEADETAPTPPTDLEITGSTDVTLRIDFTEGTD